MFDFMTHVTLRADNTGFYLAFSVVAIKLLADYKSQIVESLSIEKYLKVALWVIFIAALNTVHSLQRVHGSRRRRI